MSSATMMLGVRNASSQSELAAPRRFSSLSERPYTRRSPLGSQTEQYRLPADVRYAPTIYFSIDSCGSWAPRTAVPAATGHAVSMHSILAWVIVFRHVSRSQTEQHRPLAGMQ